MTKDQTKLRDKKSLKRETMSRNYKILSRKYSETIYYSNDMIYNNYNLFFLIYVLCTTLYLLIATQFSYYLLSFLTTYNIVHAPYYLVRTTSRFIIMFAHILSSISFGRLSNTKHYMYMYLVRTA